MAEVIYDSFRKFLGQTRFVKYFREIESSRKLPRYTAIKTKRNGNEKNSIVFLCPSKNTPIGGVKVIYNQATIIARLKEGVVASVLHPFNLNFSCTWFEHLAPVKHDLIFDQTRDFVMIPEFWAVPHARLLHRLGVRYGIYVQNGYVISRNQGEELDAAYNNAALILAISDDTAECIKLAFPECADRVSRVHYSVKSDKFFPRTNKENIICYMPRKLRRHSELVTFFLNKMIPSHWKIESIEGLDENGVAAILGRSRIFLSFSEFEGCPLPPVEAALSGCHVIGYTGEGAKEYWDPEIFTEVHSGDIKAFVKAVLNMITRIDTASPVSNTKSMKNLAERYSAQAELEDMRFVTNKVVEILYSVDGN